jgi:hypothetical protein
MRKMNKVLAMSIIAVVVVVSVMGLGLGVEIQHAFALGDCEGCAINFGGGGPAISWPGEFPTEPLCPAQCDAGFACVFHKLMCSLGLWH